MGADGTGRPVLLVLASTYPRWSGDPEPGFVHELAMRLTNRFRTIVLCPHAPGAKLTEVLDGVEVVRYRYAPERLQRLVNDGGIVSNLRQAKWKYALVPGFILAQAWMAWRLCRRHRVEIVHAHWLVPQGLIAAFQSCLPGRSIPFVVTSHGADLYALHGRALDRVKRFVGQKASLVTVVSSAMKKEIVRIGMDAAKCQVLPMGVDLEGRFTREHGNLRSANELLFVGRLVKKKGLNVLMQAMPRILEAKPDVRVTVVGFGPEEVRLRLQAKALGVDHAVDFMGPLPQSELPALYRRATLFVAPFMQAEDGDREGLGLVTIEAIACGCPVIVGDLPAVRDILDLPEDACMRVPPGDALALSAAVLRVLSDPDTASRATENLRGRLLERYDWTRVAKAYGDVLSQAVART